MGQMAPGAAHGANGVRGVTWGKWRLGQHIAQMQLGASLGASDAGLATDDEMKIHFENSGKKSSFCISAQ